MLYYNILCTVIYIMPTDWYEFLSVSNALKRSAKKSKLLIVIGKTSWKADRYKKEVKL